MKSISVKRTAAMLMVLCMLFSFAGCKKKTSSGSSDYDVEYVYEYEDESQNQSGDNSGDAASNTSSGKKKPGKRTSTGGGTTSVDFNDVLSRQELENEVTITLGISTMEKPEMEYILPAFNKKYPKVTVKLEEIASSLLDITPKWTSLAAAGKLPDVVIGSENFGYIMQQGWAYPLDNLLASDTNKNDVLAMGLDRYRYEGKLYALPFRLQFNTIFVNTDLLNSLNLQKPGYDWNLSTFMSLAKAATTDKTSGLNYIYSGNSTYGFDNKVLSAYLPDGYEQYGFNMKQGAFDLNANNAFVASNNFIKELKSVPALVSDDLKYSKHDGVTDYEARFGKDADAFVSGKVLFGNHNTWEMDWFMYTLQYNADMYPVPTADNIQQRIQTHVDFVFMNSKCTKKNYVAAYALCRFLSYDTDGCNARIDYMMNHSRKDRGAFTFYGPASASQAVLDNFKSQAKLPGGIKYMLEKVVKDPTHTQVADCDKVVPDFWSNVDQYRKSVNEKISDGADPAAQVGDLQTKINAATKSSLEYLSKQVKANQDKFYSSHDYETR